MPKGNGNKELDFGVKLAHRVRKTTLTIEESGHFGQGLGADWR